MSTCPHCQRSEGQIKAGLTQAGSQRFLCKVCRRRYTPEPQPIGYDEAVRRQAIRLYLDGNNQRRIARQIGVSQGSVSNWARAFSDSLPDELPQPEQPVEVAEIDELFTFISHKKTTPTS
jgi:transposase-like protein